MPYIPPKVVPPNPTPGLLSGYTNGTVPGFDYSLHFNQIAFEINQIAYFLSPTGVQTELGGFGYYIKSIALNSGIIAEKVVDIELRLQELYSAIEGVANKSEVVARGLGTISGHMAQQTVIQQVVAVDQMNNNIFQQNTTQAAQVAAGQEPTTVTPTQFVDNTQKMITNVAQFNAQTKAAGAVSEALTNATSYSIQTVTTWVAESAVGQFVKQAWVDTQVFVVGIFSKERADAIRKKAELATRKA